MSSKFHPNTRTAWMLVALTVVMSASVVALMHLTNLPEARILYSQFDGQDYEIFVMDADGNIEQLTHNDVDDWGASWSPDYSQIAYRTGNSVASQIVVMNADGTQAEIITPNTHNTGGFGYTGAPSWSPNGQQIAFEALDTTSPNPDVFNIHIINFQEDDITQVTYTNANTWHPQFSPNGRQIAFAQELQGTDCYDSCDIYVMNVDGSELRQLTKTPTMDVFPQWSPNGQQILFHSDRAGDSDIFVMNADGSRQINLTSNSPALERVAQWSPNGEQIVFRSDRDGDSDIYVMTIRTGETIQITDSDTDDMLPDW